jgi:hypothetical protein
MLFSKAQWVSRDYDWGAVGRLGQMRIAGIDLCRFLWGKHRWSVHRSISKSDIQRSGAFFNLAVVMTSTSRIPDHPWSYCKSPNSRWQLQLSIRERICQQELVRVLGFAAKVQFLPFFEWQVCLICLWIPTFSFPPLRFDSGQAMCSPLATSRSGEIPAMGECNFSRIYTEALALKIHGLLWTTFWVHPALSNPSFQLDSELHGRQSDLHVVWKKGCCAQKSSIGDEKVWLDGVEGLNTGEKLPLSSRNWDCRVTGA